ncbi:MAG: glycosyltransferase family 39 protein [Actinomycetota bacterium]
MRWWTLAGAVALWGVAVRFVVARSDSVPAFYYPDSWNYVVPNAENFRPHSFHGPMLYWLWDLLLPVTPTEDRVVLLQQVLGVAAVVLITLTLRRVVDDVIALAAGLVLGIQPLTMFFERSIMTEAVSVFLVALVVFCLGELLVFREAQARRSVVLYAGLAGALGLAAGALIALRPSSRWAAFVLVASALVPVLRGRTVAGASRRLRGGIAGLLLVSAGLLPMILMVENSRHYGTASLTPASGTALLSEYGHLVPCAGQPGDTARARAAIGQVCDRERPDRQPMWVIDSPLFQTFFSGEDFAATQDQMWGRARSAVVRSPFTVAGRALAVSATHVANPELQLRLYDNGVRWFEDDAFEIFDSHAVWFDGETDRTLADETPVFRVVRQTHRLPGIAFVVIAAVTILAIVRSGRRVWSARRRRQALGAELQAFERPLVHLIGAAVAAVAANELIVAVGGIAIVRYWVPMLPLLVVAGAGMLELFRERRRSGAR